MNNQSGLSFTDISSEEWREYRWKDGEIIRFFGVTHLNVSVTGGHRLFNESTGDCYYIAPGWLLLRWKAKEGQPDFVR